MRPFLLSALVLGLLAAAPAPARDGGSLPGATRSAGAPGLKDASPEQVQAIVSEISRAGDVRARVLAASERLLGVPYRFDPLGEGPGQPPDEDPRLRFDLADCQTFLETVLALARAKSAEELLPLLDEVRYQGEPRYQNRNHFFEAQWIPANAQKGWVRLVTEQIAGKDLVPHVKAISAEQWKARTVGEKIDLPPARAPIGRFPLPYLPLQKLLAHGKDIPSGTLFAVVREDRPLSPTMVTHLGIVVQKPGGTFVRHAGHDLYAQVVDEELAHFVERNLGYAKWPVLGLAFLEPLEKQPR